MRAIALILPALFAGTTLAAEPVKIPTTKTMPPCEFCFKILDIAARTPCNAPIAGYTAPVAQLHADSVGPLVTQEYPKSYTSKKVTNASEDGVSFECTTPATGSVVKNISRTLVIKDIASAPLVSEVAKQVESQNGKPASRGGDHEFTIFQFYRDASGNNVVDEATFNRTKPPYSLRFVIQGCRGNREKVCEIFAQAEDKEAAAMDTKEYGVFYKQFQAMGLEARRIEDEKKKAASAPVPKL